MSFHHIYLIDWIHPYNNVTAIFTTKLHIWNCFDSRYVCVCVCRHIDLFFLENCIRTHKLHSSMRPLVEKWRFYIRWVFFSRAFFSNKSISLWWAYTKSIVLLTKLNIFDENQRCKFPIWKQTIIKVNDLYAHLFR